MQVISPQGDGGVVSHQQGRETEPKRVNDQTKHADEHKLASTSNERCRYTRDFPLFNDHQWQTSKIMRLLMLKTDVFCFQKYRK